MLEDRKKEKEKEEIGDERKEETKEREERGNEAKDAKEGEALAWKPVKVEHLVQDQWIDFRRVAYEFPDGTVFSPYYNYSRGHYSVVVATLPDGRYLCVKQYRHGIRKVTYEFPAGGINGEMSGEGKPRPSRKEAFHAAKRELMEETGYESQEWEHLITIPSNPTLADNYAYVFRARNCKKAGEMHLDETEFLRYEVFTEEDIRSLIAGERFPQAIHVMAFLWGEGEKIDDSHV